MTNRIFVVALTLSLGVAGCQKTGESVRPAEFPAQVTKGTESHGGNIVYCPGQVPEGVVLDYYHAALTVFGNPQSATQNLIAISGLSEVKTVELFIQRLGNRYFATQLREVIAKLNYSENWISADLRKLDDSNEPYSLLPGCSLKTVATRQGDHDMYIDHRWADLLSPAQLGILVIHEALYYIASHFGLNTSEKVRAVIREVFKKDYDDETLSKLIREVGGNSEPGSMFDFLSTGWYVEENGGKYLDGKPLSIYFTKKSQSSLALHIERQDLFLAAPGVKPNPLTDEVGLLHCGGFPFECEGFDSLNRTLTLKIPFDDSHFVHLSWFYQNQWMETKFIKPGETSWNK